MSNMPQGERPHMPGYGIKEERGGLLSWDWAEQRLRESRNYWLSTVRPDGRPHAAPVWGVWHEGALIFGAGRQSRKARNLAANPAISVHLESGDEVVMFDGVVEIMDNAAALAAVQPDYVRKYGFNPADEPDPNALWLRVKPTTAHAWIEADFPNTATRWRFSPHTD